MIIIISCVAILEKQKSHTATMMSTDEALLSKPSHIAPSCPCGCSDWEEIGINKYKCKNCGCVGWFVVDKKQ